MGVLVFYKSNSEHARAVTDFLHDFERRTSQTLETVDPETPRGVQLCELYDILDYPTIIATSEDGQLRNSWRGILPTINEVSYYV